MNFSRRSASSVTSPSTPPSTAASLHGITAQGNVTVKGNAYLYQTSDSRKDSLPITQDRIYRAHPAPRNFVGREDLLLKIHETFKAIEKGKPDDYSQPFGVIIHGMGGVGKTSLAAKIVDSLKNELDKYHVLWIPADTQEDIRNSFIELAERYFPSAILKDSKDNYKEDKKLMPVIYDELCSTPSLIVFDNAACLVNKFGMTEAVQEFVCLTQRSKKYMPFYIFTSRNYSDLAWNGMDNFRIDLKCFSDEDTWHYLQTSLTLSNLSKHKSALISLSNHFQNLPIALEHFVNILNYEAEVYGVDRDPSTFINTALNFKPHEAEEAGAVDDTHSRLNSLWDYSLNLLRNAPTHGTTADLILDVMAILSPAGIPDTFLRNILKQYKVEVSKVTENIAPAIHLLRLFSIVISERHYYVHVLLQEYKRKEMQSKGKLEAHIEAVAMAMLQDNDTSSFKDMDHDTWVKNVVAICKSLLLHPMPALKMKCAQFIVKFQPMMAVDLANSALNDVKEQGSKRLRLSQTPPSILNIQQELATYYSKAGNFSQALEICKKVYKIQCESLEPDHPDLLKSKHNLAVFYAKLGDASKALQITEEVYEATVKVLGADHPDTLMAKRNWANRVAEVGKTAEALELQQEVYKAQKKVLGPRHPETLNTKQNISLHHQEAGNMKESFRISKEVTAIQQRKLGPNHVDTLNSKINLANGYAQKGDFPKALQLNQEASQLLNENYGPDHPSTIVAKNNLAMIYIELGDMQKALQLTREVSESLMKTLGREHLDTMKCKNNLAGLYARMGEHQRALELTKEVVEFYENSPPPHPPDLLNWKCNLANAYSAVGDVDEAMRISKEAYEATEEINGPNHQTTLAAKERMSLRYAEAGFHKDALRLAEEVHNARKSVFGPTHPDTLISKHNLANRYHSLGYLQRALEVSTDVFKTFKEVNGKDHNSTLAAQRLMASRLADVGRVDEALKCTEQVYKVQSEVLGPDNPETLITKAVLKQRHAEIEEMKLIGVDQFVEDRKKAAVQSSCRTEFNNKKSNDMNENSTKLNENSTMLIENDRENTVTRTNSNRRRRRNRRCACL